MGGLGIGGRDQKSGVGTKPHLAIMAITGGVDQGATPIPAKGLHSGKGERVKSTTIGPNLNIKEQGEP